MDHFTVAYLVTMCVIIYMLYKILPKLRRQLKLIEQASKFPGPSALPIIGNTLMLCGSGEDLLNNLMHFFNSYTSPFRLWLGTYLIICISTPEQMKIVLNSPKTLDKGELFDMGRGWLGEGLFLASGARWQLHRKLIQPTFGSTILKSFVAVFSARSKIFVEKLARYSDNGLEFDAFNHITEYSLQTVIETTMGVNFEEGTIDAGIYAITIQKLAADLCARATKPWLYPDFIYHRTQFGKDEPKYIKIVHTFAENVIQAKKKELHTQNGFLHPAENKEDTSIGIRKRKVFLDYLLDISLDGKMLSDEALREEVDTLMLGGSDTTAIISSFVMLMLASHPEIQEKVYQELCEIYENDDIEERDVTPENLKRMTYMGRVIKETMRIYPLTPLLVRYVKDELGIGKHTLPAGSLALLSIMSLHRNEDIWPDPLKFDPDRFLPEEVAKRDAYAFLPFSGGPRNCLGSKYAMMSMKTLFAMILRRYVLIKDNIKPIKDIRIKWEFAIRPVDPIKIRIEKRTKLS